MKDINEKLIISTKALFYAHLFSTFFALVSLTNLYHFLNYALLFFDLTFFNWFISIYLSLFRHVRKIAKSDSFVTSLSICPHGTAQFPVARCSRNLIFKYFFENLS